APRRMSITCCTSSADRFSLIGVLSATYPGRATGPSVSSETTPTDASATASSRNCLRLRISELVQYQCPQMTAANGPLPLAGTTRYAGTTPPFGLAYVMSLIVASPRFSEP